MPTNWSPQPPSSALSDASSLVYELSSMSERLLGGVSSYNYVFKKMKTISTSKRHYQGKQLAIKVSNIFKQKNFILIQSPHKLHIKFLSSWNNKYGIDAYRTTCEHFSMHFPNLNKYIQNYSCTDLFCSMVVRMHSLDSYSPQKVHCVHISFLVPLWDASIKRL